MSSTLIFAPINVDSGTFFSGNDAFISSFKPEPRGAWRGNLGKYCVLPPQVHGRFDTNARDCLFTSPDGTSLQTNPSAREQWSGSRTLGTVDRGGAGAVLSTRLGGAGQVPTTPWTRPIFSYRQGGSGFRPMTPATWTSADSYVDGCEHVRFLGRLHGYADVDCLTSLPTAVAPWPMGDTVFGDTVVLRYGACAGPTGTPIPGQCFVVRPSNAGLLQFFDAATGLETSALVPAELWGPSLGSHTRLEHYGTEPTLAFPHIFFMDGAVRLYHGTPTPTASSKPRRWLAYTSRSDAAGRLDT